MGWNSFSRRPVWLPLFFGLFSALLILSAPPVTAAGTCHFGRLASLPLTLVGNRLLVDASINDQPVRLQIDTGAESSVLFTNAALALGLPVTAAAGHHGFGVDGEINVGKAEIAKFGLAEWSVADWWIRVAGQTSGWEKERIAGLLGEDFLSHLDVEFDLTNGRMALYQAEDCENASLAYWSPDAQQVEMHNPSQEHPSIGLKMTVNGRTVRALLDSGASHSMIARSAAAEVGVVPGGPGVTTSTDPVRGLAGRPMETWIGSFASVAIAGETVRDTHLIFADFHRHTQTSETGSHIVGHAIDFDFILGADFLKSHHLLVAHSQDRVYFTYAGGPVFSAQ